MQIDHIFIFTQDGGKVADELVEFGFTEGSSRVHIGQGTTNRKFYFEDFFLEILWVHNEDEIKSEATKHTGLWKRAQLQPSISPFGLCLVHTDETNRLFENAFQYQPAYFPTGLKIDVLNHQDNLHLPWTFRLPFKGPKKNNSEPKNHRNKIQQLTLAEFDIVNFDKSNDYLKIFSEEENIQFRSSENHHLTLTFDHHKKRKKKLFKTLNLTIQY